MKLRYILSEDVNIQKHQAQLDAVSKRTNIPQEDLINYLNEMDPNGNYTRWILKQIKFQNIIVPEDNHRVWEALQQFDQHKQRLEIRDIMQYKCINDLEDVLESVLGTGSKRTGALQYNPMTLSGVKKIAEYNPYVLYSITDADSLAEIGEGTKWCTRKSYPDCQAKSYIKKGDVYVITKRNKPFIQVSSGTGEIKNTKNNVIQASRVSKSVLGLLLIIPMVAYKYAHSRGVRIESLEPIIMKEPKWAYKYVRDVIKGRWPEAESVIMKDPESAYLYASYTMGHERWLEAEPYIMRDPDVAFNYFTNIMRPGVRLYDVEPYILDHPDLARKYAAVVLEGRWPEAESSIINDPLQAALYTKDVIKQHTDQDRWPKVEPIIKQDPHAAYYYAHFVINDRWPEAEPIIMKSPRWSYDYAQYVIKDRWPEAEPYIMKDPIWAYSYTTNVIHRYTDQDRWPKAEPYIMKDPLCAFTYARDAIKGRWPEAEPYIMKDAGAAYHYAMTVLRRRWPEAEPTIKQNAEYWPYYKKVFDL